jgi:hypothetical protein
VSIDENARALLDLLKADGRTSNRAPLLAALGWDSETFDAAAAALCEAGLAKMSGKRLARAAPVTPSALSPEAEKLLAALPADGSTVGGLRLRSSLELDNDTYTRAKQELKVAGWIVLGRGRGGVVARVSAKAELPRGATSPRLVAKEADLYTPFLEWLRADLADQPGFAHAKQTATARGWKAGSGRWSRPDITAVQVVTYEWLPDVTVEVLSYEIKRFADAQKLESVYEAAAHGRWAHRASLVVELDPDAGALPDALLDELRRFRLGLYVMRPRPNSGFDIRQEIEPERTEDAEPAAVNELIDTFLGRDAELRAEYRRHIGR